MSSVEAIEDYEIIDKGELEEAIPAKPSEVASSAASSASIFHDRITHLRNVTTKDEDENDADAEVSSPLARGNLRVEQPLQENLQDASEIHAVNVDYWHELCFLSMHQLTVIAKLMSSMAKAAVSWAKVCMCAAVQWWKDPLVQNAVQAHRASITAACAALLLSLLLVHRGEEPAASVMSSQVSLAKLGTSCAPLPAAVLGSMHNFTAAQRLLAEGTPSDRSIILAAYAAHASEQFETAKRLYKKGVVQPVVHGHRARATFKAAQKELKQSVKWASRELHALSKSHRRFVAGLQDALEFDGEATAQLARQLPELIRALDGGGGSRSRAQHRLRALQRGSARAAADAAAAAAEAYEATARGVASAASSLAAHWGRLPPTVQAVANGELAAWTESWKALAAAVCVAELDAAAEGHAPPAAAEGCPNRAMSALAARLRASIDFRPRLLHLMASAQLPEGTLEHFTAACERSGGLAVQLQRVHSDLASLIGDSRAAAAS